MINKKIESIYHLMEVNEEVAAKLSSTASPADAVAILAEHNIDVTIEDLKEMVDIFSGEELPVEMLDLVAGGGKVRDFFWGFCDGLRESFMGLKDFFSGLV